MRCYLITAKSADGVVLARRVAGTNALAKAKRDELIASLELRKKDLTIEDHEVPVAKDPLLDHLNELYTELDADEPEGDAA